MPITMQWLNGRDNILVTTFTGEWTIEDFYENIDQADKALSEVHHPFVAIVDFTDNAAPPRKILTIGRRVRNVTSPYRVGLIFVNFGTLAQMIYRTLTRIEPSTFGEWHHAPSMKEAVHMADKILQSKKKDDPRDNGSNGAFH